MMVCVGVGGVIDGSVFVKSCILSFFDLIKFMVDGLVELCFIEWFLNEVVMVEWE